MDDAAPTATSLATVSAAPEPSVTSENKVRQWSKDLTSLTGLSISIFETPKESAITEARESMLAGVVPMLARFPDKFAGNGSFRPKLEVSLGHGTTIQLDGVDGEQKVVQDDFLVSLFRSYNGLMIAGAIQAPPSLREASPFTVAENVYVVILMAAGRKMLMLFTHSEDWRAMFCFTKWSRSLRGAQLSICNDRIQENAQELMSQSGLFYATAFAYALNRFDPSSMGRPSISAFSSGDGGSKSGGRDKKKLRSDDKGEWASLMSRRNAKACGDYQRKRCTRGASCKYVHQCEWCGSKGHGGVDCQSADAKQYRTGTRGP